MLAFVKHIFQIRLLLPYYSDNGAGVLEHYQELNAIDHVWSDGEAGQRIIDVAAHQQLLAL